MTVTSTQLLDSIKRAASIPSNQTRFNDAALLLFSDEETQSTILPMLLSIRQEFLVKTKNVTTVADQAEYKVPYRAVGRTLRDIQLIDSNGAFIRRLPFIMTENAFRFSADAGEPLAFTVRGENIVLLPAPSTALYKIQMLYQLAPAALVPVSEAGTVSSYSAVTGVVTMSAAVTGFTSGASMDLVDAKAGNSVLAEDITASNVASADVTFTAADLPSALAAGDYVCLSGQTPVVQLPTELVQSLVQAVVCRVLESLGDFEGLTRAQESLKKKMDAAEKLLTPRVESSTPVVTANNGLLRRSRTYGR